MDFKFLEKLDYLDDTADATLLEIRVWRTTMFAFTEAQRTYSEQLLESVKIMRSYLEEEGQSEKTKGSTVALMKQLVNIITIVASVHTHEWAEFCEIHGSYNRLMEWEDNRYEQLKEKSAMYWNKHQELVDATMAEKKTYLTYLERWTEMRDRLGAMMSKKEVARDCRFSALTGKVDVALTKYQAHFRREAKHRHKLAEQTEEIKRKFILQEKDKLDCLFITVGDLLNRIKKIIPKGTKNPDSLNFSLGTVGTEAMAKHSLVSHLKSFTFQTYQGPRDTDPTGPAQPILKEGDYKKKKPGPVPVFCVVSRDNIPMKKSESKNETSCKKLLRKSSTSPDPDGQEKNTSDAGEAEGPNLGPLDMEDDLSLEEGLVFEKKSTKKNMSSPTPPMNSFHAIESSNSLSEDTTGTYGTNGALQRYLDNETESDDFQEKTFNNSRRDERHGILKLENTPKSSKISKTLDKISGNQARPSSDSSNRISPAVKRKLSKSFNSDHFKPTNLQRERKIEAQMQESTSQDTSSSFLDHAIAEQPPKQPRKKILDKDLSRAKGSEEEKRKVIIGYRLAKRRRSKQSLKDQTATKERDVDSLPSSGPAAAEKGREVAVLVMKDRVKVEADEISIRAGMKIKQTRPANENGMAYGYKKTKVGIRKYGYYPANLVTLYNTRACSSDNLN